MDATMVPSPTDAAPAPRRQLALSWRLTLLLLLVTATGLCGLALSPTWQNRFGILGNGVWFLDSYAILASSDAAHAGLDPYQPNPLDVYRRPHSYSRWWLGLSHLGLTRDDNFLFGGTMVVAFVLTSVLVLRPRHRAELGWHIMLLLSPPVMLAVNRANNDLVVFALLSLGLLLLGRAADRTRPGWFGAAVAVATGLKFYPVAAAGALLGLRPARRGLGWTVAVSLLGLALLATVWADFRKAVFPVPIGTHVFGAAVFWGNLGWAGRTPIILSLAVLAAGALWLARRGHTDGLGRADDPASDFERLAFLTGALLLLVCFAGGISYAYRLMFGFWLAPWLWTQGWGSATAGRARTTARLTAVLLTVVVWMDGIYCAVVNTFVGRMGMEQLRRWETAWNLSAQPLAWLLMLLLAAWVAGALLAAARSLRAQSRPAG